MKKILFIVGTVLSFTLQLFSQPKNTITYQKTNWGGRAFFKDGRKLSYAQTMANMNSNPEAFKKVLHARNISIVSFAKGFAGGNILGNDIVKVIKGAEPRYKLDGFGVVLIIASFLADSKVREKSQEAINLFNGGRRYGTNTSINIMKLCLNENGIGFSLKL